VTVTVRRLLAVVCWLFVGHLTLGGLYWLLLNVPESNVLALGTSALLLLLIVIGLGIVDVTGLVWLHPDRTLRAALGRSLRALPVFLLALALWFVINWIAGAIEIRYEARTGEITAWFIAKFNWTRTNWVHRLIPLLIDGIRYVLGVSLVVSLIAAATMDGFVAIFRPRWLLRALSPGSLVIIAVSITALIWLPWQYVYWRPAAIPANVAEVLFNGIKLGIIGLLAHVGWALVLWAPQRHNTPDRPAQRAI
jgi:hypothetical protein